MSELRMSVGGTTPPTPSLNEVSLYVKTDKRFYMQDDTGAEVRLLTDESTIASLSTQLPLTSTGGANPTIALNNVTTTSSGAMLYQDKVKLDSATALNNANQIVSRDALGNFTANEITATLNGQASSVLLVPSLIGDITTNGSNNITSISAGVIDNSKISPTAGIDISKLAVDPRDRSTHTGLQLASTISDLNTSIDLHLINDSPIVDGMISNTANIAITKLATNPLDRSNHTGTQLSSTISDFTSQVNLDVANYISNNLITNNEISTTAAIELSKLATNPLDRSNHTGTQTVSTISDFASQVPLALTAGNGINIAASTINILGTTNRIDTTSGTVDIATTYIGQNSISTVGTITTGVWNGSPIPTSSGGTGASTTGEATNKLLTTRTLTSSDNIDGEDSHIFADASASVLTIALPPAGDVYKYFIKKIDAANNVVINADPGDLIEGNPSVTLTTQYESITLISDGGTTWYQTT